VRLVGSKAMNITACRKRLKLSTVFPVWSEIFIKPSSQRKRSEYGRKLQIRKIWADESARKSFRSEEDGMKSLFARMGPLCPYTLT
jgi:hypothetical protein